MFSEPTIEEALINFSNLVIPNLIEVQGAHAAATNPLIRATTPFFILLTINFLSMVILSLAWRMCVKGFEATILLIGSALSLTNSSLTTRFTTSDRDRANRSASTRKQPLTGRTRVVEEEDEFQSWERLADSGIFWETQSEPSEDVHNALSILGVAKSATENEIRKAYLTLMKQCHPDLFMNASKRQQEHIRHMALQIRGAYDVLSKQLYQVQ